MNEKLTLREVQETYGKYNLLLPQATDVQINPFYRFHVEVVPVDVSENNGDIFKTGTAKTGTAPNGKDIWEDTFAPSKSLLNKLALAAGIQFDPEHTYGERIDRMTYVGHARGAIKKADGTARIETDQKTICLEDEEARFKIEFMDKADKGITDEKQAKAAADIYKGKWIDSVNKYGKPCKAYLIDSEERARYIERSILVNMSLLRKTWAEKAMTGAKLRVIRALLGTKGTYTKSELQKGFAIPTVVFSPDYTDPQVRAMMLQQGMASVNNMFGTPSIPVKTIDFSDTVYEPTETDLNNEAYTSDTSEESEIYEEPGSEQPVVENAPTSAAEGEYTCEQCGSVIPERVWNYSVDKFKKPLCMKCQRGAH